MPLRIAIAGGGTGGHVFPAIAIAEGFLRKDPKAQLLFFGTKMGLEAQVLKGNYSFFPIRVSPIVGSGPTRVMKGVRSLPLAFLDSYGGLRRFYPHLVIGVGGYASGPVLAVAFLMGIPTVIQEQNIMPGITNRILGRFVSRVFISFEETRKYFNRSKTIVVGNPVRRSIREVSNKVDARKGKPFTVLIFGGSQGARALNEAVLQSLDYMDDVKGKLRFIHQTGEAGAVRAREAYEKKGFAGSVYPFINDMAQAYAECNLVISRAGATTLAEITAVGRASLLVPYPYAYKGHQEINARWLASQGAAEVLMEDGLTGRVLAEKIKRCASERKRLLAMEERAKSLARPDAADKIVEECRRLANV